MNDDAYRGIDRILLTLATAPQDDAGRAYLFASDGRHKSRLRTWDFDAVSRARQATRIVDHAGVASLELDHLAKSVEGPARGDNLIRELLARGDGLRRATKIEHPGRQL